MVQANKTKTLEEETAKAVAEAEMGVVTVEEVNILVYLVCVKKHKHSILY